MNTLTQTLATELQSALPASTVETLSHPGNTVETILIQLEGGKPIGLVLTFEGEFTGEQDTQDEQQFRMTQPARVFARVGNCSIGSPEYRIIDELLQSHGFDHHSIEQKEFTS